MTATGDTIPLVLAAVTRHLEHDDPMGAQDILDSIDISSLGLPRAHWANLLRAIELLLSCVNDRHMPKVLDEVKKQARLLDAMIADGTVAAVGGAA